MICIWLLISVKMVAQNKQYVTVTDMLKIQSISDVTLSPDGSNAAFVVTAIENEETSKLDYKYVKQIWMVATDGHATPRQLTAKENAAQPAWSPQSAGLSHCTD